MSKKKSLGHNPLAYSTRGHASFDFITPSDQREKSEELGDQNQDDQKAAKTTASYYLEEQVVEKIKVIADKREMSYSALVNDILKSAINKLNNR